ncbi:hypothetical protein JTE90_015968 [Oedothorax gibbosus]|uniref:Uncharacterized protein n=1 Tax=Oedothorax gibbosus TaxID=931172 RepID=A0AAV6VR14_9ARAC|nr:hypothetical protein JTE90_015968 [Oedothorax gibbosus]
MSHEKATLSPTSKFKFPPSPHNTNSMEHTKCEFHVGFFSSPKNSIPVCRGVQLLSKCDRKLSGTPGCFVGG